VTEADWLACDNPNFAVAVVRAKNPSRRKARLAAAAGLRHFWPELSAVQRRAVEAAERYADGESFYHEMQATTVRIASGQVGTLAWAVARVTHRVAAEALWPATCVFLPVVDSSPVYTNPPFPDGRAFAERSRPMLDIFRCVYGNPFRPTAVAPGWRTTAVLGLARAVYDGRAFDRLPILADALEDAGCDHPAMLAHCRDGGPHVRGCWVIDGILGRK
jgi:hypothetical protein